MNSTENKTTITRKDFCVKCLICGTAIALGQTGLKAMPLAGNNSFNVPLPDKKGMRKLFIEKGTCSQLLLYVLNREYGHNNTMNEKAIDQLAGGIASQGYQCGMLWGASMGAAQQASHKFTNKDHAMAHAVNASIKIIDNFINVADSANCSVITSTDPSKAFSKIKLIFSAGKCFTLAHKWPPVAIKTTNIGLAEEIPSPKQCATCASEVVQKLGGTAEEEIMVAGFSGGLGLSGNACGALSAAIWKKTQQWCIQNPKKSGYSYNGADTILDCFSNASNGKILCSEITGIKFDTLNKHSGYIKQGGCKHIISALTKNC